MPNVNALRLTAMFAAATLLTACAGTGPEIDGCAGWRPILVGSQDVISEQTAQAILAHNLTGRARCGW